jgi:hypothetical protein
MTACASSRALSVDVSLVIDYRSNVKAGFGTDLKGYRFWRDLDARLIPSLFVGGHTIWAGITSASQSRVRRVATAIIDDKKKL